MDRLKRYWPYLFLLLFTIIFFNKLLISPLSIFSTPGDIAYFNYPLKNFLAESLKNHQLPLWNSQIGTGFPILADSPVGTFYLPNLVLFYFFPTSTAFNLSYIFLFVTTSFGVYALCRTYQLSKFSSLFASLAFTFSGFFIARIIHTSFIQVVSLLPWGFWLIEKTIITQKKRYLFLFSFLISQLVFIGYLQAVIYSLTAQFIYFIVRIFLVNRPQTKILLKSVEFILMVLLGLGMAAVQIFPTLELLQHSTRSSGLNIAESFTWSGSPKILLMFFNPFFFGNLSKGTFYYHDTLGFYWENVAYSGLLTPFLAAASFFFVKKNRWLVVFFIFLVILSLLLAIGQYGPLHVIFTIPPLSYFRIPARFLFLSSFGFSILAALTIDALENKKIKILWILGLIFVIIISLDIFKSWYSFNTYTKISQFEKKPDSVLFLKEYNFSGERVTSLWPYLINPPLKTKGGWANQNEEYISNFFTLQPNVNLIFHTSSSDFYTSFTTRRMQVFRDFYVAGIGRVNDENAEINKLAMNLLKLQNVGYIITHYSIKNDELETIYSLDSNSKSANYTIYKLRNHYPRLRMVYQNVLVKNVPELIEKMSDVKTDFSKTVLLEKPITTKKGQGSFQVGKLVDNHTRLDFTVESDSDGFLVIADTYYPGWKAYVDGKETEILAANVNQRAVYLEKGEHHVVFSYEPKSLKIGLLITLVAHGILLTIFASKLKLFQRWKIK